ncbi:hypothetical protein HYU12_00125 [Candidatus Woesearchaeota archaeon]|nr:hypothetical protein [Candidatus Woesearchaeota archaeon]
MKKRHERTTARDTGTLIAFLILLIAAIFLFSTGRGTPDTSSLLRDQQLLIAQLSSDGNSPHGIIYGNSVNTEKLEKLASKDYETLKKELGIKSDFALYFEDENGKPISITGKPCIGSKYVKVSGYDCG